MFTPDVVFGYHGCDEDIARRVLEGDELKPSENAHDWLGHGIYFWESSPARALLWARQNTSKCGGSIQKPAVVGAIIRLGRCLSLIDPENTEAVRQSYLAYIAQCKVSGIPPLLNKGTDSKARFLDCTVMNLLHDMRSNQGLPAFDTVRGFFIEGAPVYPTAGLRSLDHIQICVRRSDSIIGFFRPNFDPAK